MPPILSNGRTTSDQILLHVDAATEDSNNKYQTSEENANDVIIIDIEESSLVPSENFLEKNNKSKGGLVSIKVEPVESTPSDTDVYLKSDEMSNYSDIVQTARNAFMAGKTKDMKFRKQQLKALLRMYEENKNAMMNALATDLHKCKQESVITEIEFLLNDIRNTLMNFEQWAKPEKPSKGLVNMLDEAYIFKDPYGVVLIMGAWNYPLQLTLLPLNAAIAAGNCAIIKPSELAPASAKLMEDLVSKYLDPECYRVINGGVVETTKLLENRFDYIFFTGSTAVGKIIHAAANKHLTPTTLELGGKSPVYLDSSANIEVATKRILWGKFLNAGQTCIAPDYLLCTKEVQEAFVNKAKDVIRKFYGDDIKASPDLCRIINDRHFQRLMKFLENNSKIAIGGDSDASERYIEPTILANVSTNDPIMQEEIFGPILPIVTIENAYEAINFINEREKPLSLYIFSNNRKDTKLILDNTSSGGTCVNDTIMHLTVETLPFGGVGSSGMGSYHGKQSFDTFVHKRSCLVKNLGSLGETMAAARYPPYSERKLKFLVTAMKKRRSISFKYFPYLLIFATGLLAGIGVHHFTKMFGSDSD